MPQPIRWLSSSWPLRRAANRVPAGLIRRLSWVLDTEGGGLDWHRVAVCVRVQYVGVCMCVCLCTHMQSTAMAGRSGQSRRIAPEPRGQDVESWRTSPARRPHGRAVKNTQNHTNTHTCKHKDTQGVNNVLNILQSSYIGIINTFINIIPDK